MIETEKMQKLHQLAVKGESLTAQEKAELQNWYENLDREEDSILNDSQPVQSIPELRKSLAQTTKQAAKISRDVETLLKQNENLRKENEKLKKTLELRLTQTAA